MFSRKFSPSHPNFVADVGVTDTLAHQVASLISAPAVLGAPASSVATDGASVPIFLSGRVILNSGATPGNLTVVVSHIEPNGTLRNIFSVSQALPANQSGTVVPFGIRIQGSYDVQRLVIFGTAFGVIDPVNFSGTGWVGFNAFTSTPDLNFIAQYQFSVAPLPGTTVEITEFRFGA